MKTKKLSFLNEKDGQIRFFQDSRMYPEIEVKDGKYIFSLELAGFDKKNIKTSIEGKCLVVTAKKEEKTEKSYLGRDFSSRYYLPENVSVDGEIDAKYQSGILTITFPSKELPKPEKKEISIK